MTLHFAPDADTPAIAEELSRLPEVERASSSPPRCRPRRSSRGRGRRRRPPAPRREATAPAPSPRRPQVRCPIPWSAPRRRWSSTRRRDWRTSGTSSAAAGPIAPGRGPAGSNVVIADVDWGYRTSTRTSARRSSARTTPSTARPTSPTAARSRTARRSPGSQAAAINGAGMAGVAYDADAVGRPGGLRHQRRLGGNAWARGIDWVRTTDSGGRRKVIILEVQTGSFGNYEQVPSVNAAIRTAIAAGVVVCVAAGNGDKDAGLDDSGNAIPETGSILVGATAYHATENKRAWFSNWGPRITVSCPGDASHDLTCNSTVRHRLPQRLRRHLRRHARRSPARRRLMLAVNPGLTHADVRTHPERHGLGRSRRTPARRWARSSTPGPPSGRPRRAPRRTTGDLRPRGGRRPLAQVADRAERQLVRLGVRGGWIDLLEVGRNARRPPGGLRPRLDGAVWHKWQVAPNGAWSGWAVPRRLDRPARRVDRNADGRLEVFARGSDKALWHIWQVAPERRLVAAGSRSAAGSTTSPPRRTPTAASRSSSAARTRRLWHKWQIAPERRLEGWASQGGWIDRLAVGPQRRRPARGVRPRVGRRALAQVAGRAQRRLVAAGPVAAAGSTCSTSARTPMGGSRYSSAASTVRFGTSGRLRPTARGAAGPSRGGWIDLLDVEQNNDGRLEVFARGPDRRCGTSGRSPERHLVGLAVPGRLDRPARIGQNAL